MNSLPLDPTCKARSKKFSISKTIKHKNKNNKNKNIKKKKKKLFPQQVAFAFSQLLHRNPLYFLSTYNTLPQIFWVFFGFFFFFLPLRPLIKFSLSQSSKRGHASVRPAVTSAVVTTPHTGYYFSLFWDLG